MRSFYFVAVPFSGEDRMNDTQRVSAPKHGFRPLTPEQRVHKSQFDFRDIALERDMATIVAHTVLPGRNRRDFAGLVIDDLSQGVDVVVSKFWKRLPSGYIRSGTKFSLYAARFNYNTGEIEIGGAHLNPFAKDLSCRPYKGAVAKTFDYVESHINYNTGLMLDKQIESAARDRRILVGRPRLYDVLMAYNPDRPARFEETQTLLDDVVYSILADDPSDENEEPPFHLQFPRSGVIEDFDANPIDGHCIQLKCEDGIKMLELPAFIKLDLELITKGREVKEGQRLGRFCFPGNIYTWEDVDNLLVSEGQHEWLLRTQWESKHIMHTCRERTNNGYENKEYYLIPYCYISKEQAKFSVRQFRDVYNLLGRTVYNDSLNSVSYYNEAEGAVQLWDTEGDLEAMIVRDRGLTANFRDVRTEWEHFFYDVGAPQFVNRPRVQVDRILSTQEEKQVVGA